MCPVKKVFLKTFQNSQGNTPVLNCLFNKIAGLRSAALLKRDSSKVVLHLFCI